jgi:hypothetical protein
MALVQYFVFKRPKHPETGEIIRGKIGGAKRNIDNSIAEGGTLWFPAVTTTKGANDSYMSTTAASTNASTGKIDGEPWILHSSHFALEDAIAQSKSVISAVGSENVKILKSIAHELDVILS